MLTLRRYWLPHEDDEPRSLARALWLQKQHSETLTIATANGINKAFGGK
ncbi:DUF6890 family protein [Shewanella surugensis]